MQIHGMPWICIEKQIVADANPRRMPWICIEKQIVADANPRHAVDLHQKRVVATL
jgi:disulfide oxidoreductase YuzD